jgi:hypothetical protein
MTQKIVDPALRKLSRSFTINSFEMISLATIILATDIEREKAVLTTGIDETFGLVEVAFAKAVLFEDVAPAA